MEWVREGPAVEIGPYDAARQWRPWVIEEPDGTLRMWYSGHDGETSRIIEAIHPPGETWKSLGPVVDIGDRPDDPDSFGVESPCVIKTPGGYMMAYAGFDGEVSRLLMATSPDGHSWQPHGTFIQRGVDDDAGAADPCILPTAQRWWLFFSGHHDTDDGRRTSVLAAISPNGASWDRLGAVIEPVLPQEGVSHPCAFEHERRLYLFFVTDTAGETRITLATSHDGITWKPQGHVMSNGDEDDALVHTPCVLRRRDGSLHMWYSSLPRDDTTHAYRICSATFDGPWA